MFPNASRKSSFLSNPAQCRCGQNMECMRTGLGKSKKSFGNDAQSKFESIFGDYSDSFGGMYYK